MMLHEGGTVTQALKTMQGFQEAARAYAASARRRTIREQEADVFRYVNGGLRRGRHTKGVELTRALADTVRLWTSVIDLLRDPENQLPAELRASIISVGITVRREAQSAEPDIEFIIGINEHIAAGLSATP
jgi:flagellar biosynthesis regulator FlaF